MPYLIDGSNLGGVLGGALGARDRKAVVQRLLPWTRRRRRVTLIFDGPADPLLATRYGGLVLVYSKGRSADAVIRQIISGSGARRSDWTVITDDVELARSCQRSGAKVQPIADLLEQLPEDPETAALGDEEDPRVNVEEWESYFDQG